ncbi:hypothetical protein T03_1217 [Trichinella britovi]|uniref:Uncharacterized protein n=1 Tax=Trichinella britovi TaxID=45882 RepID=A0A0V1ALU8_TRIBR|nr:hypothetical protein T03_1217 [Trichinella britovi]
MNTAQMIPNTWFKKIDYDDRQFIPGIELDCQ